MSASDAYKKRVTNCVGRANLLIALCRLSDVPSRYASKIVYDSAKDGKNHSKSHLAHVWTQVYLNKKWISVEQSPLFNVQLAPGYISTYNYGYTYFGGCNEKSGSGHKFGPMTVNGINLKVLGTIP